VWQPPCAGFEAGGSASFRRDRGHVLADMHPSSRRAPAAGRLKLVLLSSALEDG